MKKCVTDVVTAPLKLNPTYQLSKNMASAANKHYGDNIVSNGLSNLGNKAAEGIKNAAGNLGDGVTAKFLQGAAGGLADTVNGIVQVVAKPGDALEGLTELAENPVDSAVSIGKAIAADCKKDIAGCMGNIAFQTAGIAATMGAGAAVGGMYFLH